MSQANGPTVHKYGIDPEVGMPTYFEGELPEGMQIQMFKVVRPERQIELFFEPYNPEFAIEGSRWGYVLNAGVLSVQLTTNGRVTTFKSYAPGAWLTVQAFTNYRPA
ncbi:hypothetical protein [Timonella senegalensis]|uniref:hypothetical protein n=1 Tax=Timonella senegalensis TaxID=1465825 RepID=UPI000314D9A2|nr:hypothetical protein [Timonella senegalensis]